MGSGVSVTQGSFDGDTQSVSFPKRRTTQNDEIQRGVVAMIDSVIDKCIRKSNLNVQALCPASNRECKESKREYSSSYVHLDCSLDFSFSKPSKQLLSPSCFRGSPRKGKFSRDKCTIKNSIGCNHSDNMFFADPKCHDLSLAKVLNTIHESLSVTEHQREGENAPEIMFKTHWKINSSDSLGVGSSAKVYSAVSMYDPRIKVAVKMLDKTKLSLSVSKKQKLLVMSRNEAQLIRKLNHPNIAKFIGYYDTSMYIYIVTEYCDGGELFDYIINRPEGINEEEGKIVARQLASALSHIHNRGVMHRDVKPENILLQRKNDLSSIKLMDFGLSRAAKQSQSFLGTAGYVAPEMATNSTNCGMYTSAVDMWALGVTLYAALTGYMPFEESDEGDSLARGVERIQEQPVLFPQEVFQGISKQCIHCLSMLLTIDPKMRMTADEMLVHPWIAQVDVREDRQEEMQINSSPNSILHVKSI